MFKVTDQGNKAKLILDSSSSSDSEDEQQDETVQVKGRGKSKTTDGEFTINKNYAERYDNWRNLEEMQKLKNRLGVKDVSELKEEDSSSESSSEEEADWSMENEKAFLKTLACLKTKDPKIYTDKFGFFNEAEEENKEPSSKKKKDDKKPFTIRDHERTMILEKVGQLSDDENSDTDQLAVKSYPEELASIKKQFSKALNEIDSGDEEEGNNLLSSNLLKRRKDKSLEEKEKEEEEYRLWLKGELDKVDKRKLSKDDVNELKSLRDYWNDDKLDEGEKFLRDYILSKKYIDPQKEETDYIPSYKEVVEEDNNLSEDEKFDAEQEEFEHKYNFRFEEPDQDFIKRYPRTIQESMRREETKRKEQRQKAKERKEDMKARKKDEVQRLKALKRKEIMSKIQKLQEITGDPDLNVSEIDIDGDFDPEEYDRRMQALFSDDYYQHGDEVEKPVFEYDEEIDGDNENWEKWVPAREGDDETGEANEELSSDDGEELDEVKKEDIEFFGRSRRKSATEKELIEASMGKRGRKNKKRNAFLEVLEQKKPTFDPKIHKSFEKYYEEYYNLDFEDIVGGVKCRFKYHKTVPNDFGLTTDEILKAEDKELNQWASLKKTYQYRADEEELYEVKAYQKKAEKQDLKKRLLLSVYQPVPEKSADENHEDNETSSKQKKRKKKKSKKNKLKPPAVTTEDELAEPETKKTKKNKVKPSAITTDDEPVETETKKTKNKLKPSAVTTKDEPVKIETEKIRKRKLDQRDSDNKGISTIENESSPKRKKVQPEENTPSVEKVNGSGTPKLSKRQRKNKKKLQGRSENGNPAAAKSPVKANIEPKIQITSAAGNKKKSKNKRDMKRKTEGKDKSTNDSNGVNVDEDRLRSYGLNPKKFKKQMKYGTSQK